jgi:hypothetical protein
MIQQTVEAAAKLIGGNFQARIFFLHIPKCGGISVSRSIQSCYNFLEKRRGGRYLDLDASRVAAKILSPSIDPFSATDDYELFKFREFLLLYFMSEKSSKFISGHFGFSELAFRAFHSEFAFLTMLRDPVKRWISLYFYNRGRNRHAGVASMELADYIRSDFARSQGFDLVKFIGGPSPDGDYSSPLAIERTKKNLDKFDIVGCLEYQENFLAKFKERFGVDLNLPKLNQSPVSVSRRDSLITEELKKEIEVICQPDLEVYRYAVDRFVKGPKP